MPSSQDKLARLVIIEGKDNRDKGKIIPLKQPYIIVGRGQADIILNDLQVSRAHVALEFNGQSGELSFTDLGSTNGTLVNGELRKSGVLKDRDRLKIGNTVFDCQLEFESQTELGTVGQRNLELQPSKSISVSLKGPSQLKSEEIVLQEPVVSNNPVVQKTRVVEPANDNPLKPNPTLKSYSSFYQKMPKSVKVGALTLVVLIILVAQMTRGPQRQISNRSLDNYISEITHLIETKQLDQAKSTALEAGKAFPSNSVPMILLGNIYFEQRKMDLAIDSYRRSLTLQPVQLITYTRLIRLYLILNKKEEAKALLSQYLPLLDASEINKKLHVQTGELFLDYPELEPNKDTMLKRARLLQSKYAPEDPIGYKLESNLISSSEKSAESRKESEELLKKGLALSPKDEWIFDRLFYLKLAQQNSIEAINTLDSWIKMNPQSTKPLLLYSYLKFNEKNFLGALPYLQKIMNLLAKEPYHPHYAEALNLMGQISLQQNQLAEAESFLKQSCDLGYKPSCSHPLLTGNRPNPAAKSP
jgi:tetratricopeptide (TPR) repeat protein